MAVYYVNRNAQTNDDHTRVVDHSSKATEGRCSEY